MSLRRTITLGVFALMLAGGVVAGERYRPREPLPASTQADKIMVFKSERKLVLLRDGAELRSYKVALGRNPVGPKTRQGDSKTPEGLYRIDYRNPKSSCHLALHISYPDARDTAAARKAGVSAGGAIMIHGIKNGMGWLGAFHSAVDWTDGCIAVSDREIEEIWKAVPDGTPIEILP